MELGAFCGARIVDKKLNDDPEVAPVGVFGFSGFREPQRSVVGFRVVLGTFGPQKCNKHARASHQ